MDINMKPDKTASIFKFKLPYDLGYGYAEIINVEESHTFRYLITVYNIFDVDDSVDMKINDIVSQPVYLGPLNINKFPNVKGLNAWKLIGTIIRHKIQYNPVKNYRGIINKYDWSTLSPWYIVNWHLGSSEADLIKKQYEEVRHLETLILSHKDSIPEKVAIRLHIDRGDNLTDFLNFNDLGSVNIYLQVINTYYPKEKTVDLIKVLPSVPFEWYV
jgi:hypothetical protein